MIKMNEDTQRRFSLHEAAETQNSSVPVYVFGLISAVIGWLNLQLLLLSELE